MSERIGYVVVEWNQASHRPRIVDDEVHDVRKWAEEVAAIYASDAQGRGRGERYTVAEVVEDES